MDARFADGKELNMPTQKPIDKKQRLMALYSRLNSLRHYVREVEEAIKKLENEDANRT